MDGLLIIDKEKDYTSRDVVNIVSKVFKTKKVGHTGTLDPLATGVLVICVNRATKLVELLSSLDKEYIATFEFGTLTDTLDNTGNIIKDEDIHIKKEELEKVLKNMIGNYSQTVPIYSAVKVNGRKLYEYARNNEEVTLPVHDVNIYSLDLLDIKYVDNKTIATIKCHVSKGTYIRSLGNDIASNLNTCAIMTDLRRTKQGKFLIEKAIKINEVNSDTKLIDINDYLDYPRIKLDDKLYTYVKNGRYIDNIYNEDIVSFVTEDNNILAIYKSSEDGKLLKPFKMFL
ncbi:MAG TPA: tRNA pseudouridine(55) synthase TruB [Bacilli bacterium]|nr:tRNA pseudouridine(55) synthase TruB [Bacilli bacterium]